jgi:hypothetical protein
MKDKKRYYFKDIIIVILLIIGIVFGYLALLNGRYEVITTKGGVFLWDKWNKFEVIDTDGKKIDVFKEK